MIADEIISGCNTLEAELLQVISEIEECRSLRS